MLKTRKTCRACGSSALLPVVSLGEQELASNFVISKDFPPTVRELPLELVRCAPEVDENACGLVQLRHTVPGDLMYSSYGYRSGINQTMTAHLGGIAHGLEERLNLQPDDLVVDIGANDGTLLLSYRKPGLKLVGFEPSNIRPLEPTPQIEFIRDYFSALGLKERCGDRKARIVTSIAMFYDLEEPNRFVADVASVLAKDGLWVLEMSYLPSMLANNSFDTICHEHLEYYAIDPIERMLHRHNLRIADAELNDANGGSLRITACRADSPFREHSLETRSRIYRLKKQEFELKLDTAEPYRAFAENSETIRRELPALLLQLMSAGKKIYGYGASTKGNVILQYCGLSTAYLTAIADRNPAKWGGNTVGSGIPIISEEEMRAAKPDYLLVLPWHFLTEFKLRESEFLARGGRFISPIPKVTIVS
ncbi:MAG: class I SAM-dependent methyltransferase [Polyangiaceae bacterium]|nr:class I SAM-dependent methyltransferase [Polyangiaceae bacterium]